MNMYPEEMIYPMREELTGLGFREMKTPEEVDVALAQSKDTVLVVVNSICGCAAGRGAGSPRPADLHLAPLPRPGAPEPLIQRPL